MKFWHFSQKQSKEGNRQMKRMVSKRVVSIFLCMALLMTYLPLSAFAAEAGNTAYTRVADTSTMDNWTKYFDLREGKLDTSNAGGVWTDKSVFTDASAFDGAVTMQDDGKNFLTALSALAANKEVVGYSTVPTDTVLILDLSGSMSTANVRQLVTATNDAIKTLLGINKNNRVGVVLYAGASTAGSVEYEDAVTRLMPLDSYSTTDANGNYVVYANNEVRVVSGVTGTVANPNFGERTRGGGTYMQAGLWEAYKMFDEVPDSDIVIGGNNWQSGEHRMPVVVLMSDGAPTHGASNFADVENQTYGRNNTRGADVGNGTEEGITSGQGFLVQLTASYIKNRIENKYQVKSEIGTGRSLFYTLGFNINAATNNIAYSVLNPDASTVTDSLWATYNNSSATTMNVSVMGRNGNATNVAVRKNSYATSKSYVDEFFPASSDGLTTAFKSIVEEILLQSRYYPTHLEGGNPDFSGYITFTDTLGEYMEVKAVNGILLGDTLFDGHMMASKLADTSADGLGTPENPTALGDEFIRSVKTRLGITETADAQALVAKAYADGQLAYNGPTDWSNYIAWYAKADGTYVGFYDKDGTEPLPADAVYINRSYGFLGETTGSIKNSDMMYMSVQVRQNIATGEQTVIWKIPAALVPMITYSVTLNGNGPENATDVNIKVENVDKVSPIRLIYETGLRSDLNEFNITRITDADHLDTDGHTRLFWNNYFDIDPNVSHDQHITTMSEFMPNKENERFYYVSDSAVFKKKASGDGYELVGENESVNGGLDTTKTYYHRRYIFTQSNAEQKPIFFYEEMSAASIRAAEWRNNFETLDKQTVGAWVVPKGTPARELQMYDEEKADKGASTQSAKMIFHPYLTEHNNTVYVDMNLGNNGLLSVIPATGIKVSKTVDVFETGTSDTFKFRITASVSGSVDSWITPLGATPSGAATPVTFANGVYEVQLKKDQTLWLSGIPAGTAYTVEEISDNADYKIKSVHVNSVSTGKTATGTVAQYLVDDVQFVNTAIGEGDLVVTKQVVDANGQTVDVNDSIKFTAKITLKTAAGARLSGTYASSKDNVTLQNGEYTVQLSDGESFVLRGLPEGTRYEVTEINMPQGFALDNGLSELTGVVDASANDRALLVNTYTPISVNGDDISVVVTKTISGNRAEWLSGETYSFVLERTGPTAAIIGTKTISVSDTQKQVTFSLVNEPYATAGTYYYKLTETVGTQGGVTYDSAQRRFSVVVADSDMDGNLEIVSVNNELNTTVSGNWLVEANFNNVYAPVGSATATVNIQKRFDGTNHALSGYRFALYDGNPFDIATQDEVNTITQSGLTNAAGEASVSLQYSAADVGNTYTYYLAEINGGQTIQNIRYADTLYKVEVTVNDNLDGTISTVIKVDDAAYASDDRLEFLNTYVPSASDFVTISGEKTISGDRVLNADEFAFEISAVTTGAPMPAEIIVKNAADGSFSFPAIEFSQLHATVGQSETYVYTIRERNDNLGGFAYDDAEYEVSVTVTNDGTQITATPTLRVCREQNWSSADDIQFVNTYDAEDAQVVLNATKLLTGKTMQADEFTFEVRGVTSDAPMPNSVTAKNAVNGEVVFEKIVFDKAGTYVYEVTEQNGGSSNYDYDQSVYTVTVTVTDDAQGKLWADVSLAKNGAPSTEMVFRNGFVPTPIVYDIYADFGGEKMLNGRGLAENEFAFVLINAATGEQIGKSVKNDADGKVAFPAVTINAAGVYHYKIAEVIGDEKGITYDTSSFHVRLEVVQDDDGVLTVNDKQLYKGTVTKQEVAGVLTEVTQYENITDGGSLLFVNEYKPDPADMVISGTKNLVGRELQANEFTFNLYFANLNAETGEWEKGELVEQTVNGADGAFAFEARQVEAGYTYVYFITEDATDPQAGIAYDATAYMLVVTAEDNLDGTIEVQYAYSIDGKAVEALVFTNVYTPITNEGGEQQPQPEPQPEKDPDPQPQPEQKPQPKPENPKTGDTFNRALWFALLFISGGGVLGCAVYDKKKKQQKEN